MTYELYLGGVIIGMGVTFATISGYMGWKAGRRKEADSEVVGKIALIGVFASVTWIVSLIGLITGALMYWIARKGKKK